MKAEIAYCSLGFLLLVSCQSIDVSEDNEDRPPEAIEEIAVEEEVPEQEPQFFSVPLIEETVSLTLSDEIPLPVIEDDLLPSDSFLRLIEIKKRYFRYNAILDSPFSDNTVTAIQGSGNSYYLGTLRGGVYRYDGNDNLIREIITPRDSIVNRSITSIEIFEDRVFISSFSGLFSFGMKENNLEKITPFGKDHSILTAHKIEGTFYWGSSNGELFESEGEEIDELFNFQSPVRSISSYEKTLIIATGMGLYTLDLNGSDMIPEKIHASMDDSPLKINDILVVENLIFISSDKGLWVYSNKWQLLEHRYVNRVILDSVESENYIYMGTHRSGIIIYDKINKSYSLWGLDMGIPSLNIPAVGVAGEDVLISVPDKGIVRIDEIVQEKL